MEIRQSLTTFVGRNHELESLTHQLEQRRLVTLVGPGGVGKTRLAFETARRLIDRFPDGAAAVRLGEVDQGAGVDLLAAAALGIDDHSASTTAEQIVRFLSTRSMLLVLDNCEHVLNPARDLVTGILDGSPPRPTFSPPVGNR